MLALIDFHKNRFGFLQLFATTNPGDGTLFLHMEAFIKTFCCPSSSFKIRGQKMGMQNNTTLVYFLHLLCGHYSFFAEPPVKSPCVVARGWLADYICTDTFGSLLENPRIKSAAFCACAAACTRSILSWRNRSSQPLR